MERKEGMVRLKEGGREMREFVVKFRCAEKTRVDASEPVLALNG